MLHVVGVAVPVYEPREFLVLLLQPLRGDLCLLQQGLPLQLQEGHVQVRVQDLGDGVRGGERERRVRATKKRLDGLMVLSGEKQRLELSMYFRFDRRKTHYAGKRGRSVRTLLREGEVRLQPMPIAGDTKAEMKEGRQAPP